MSAKILQMPKSNQHLWDDLFNGFINQIDRAKDFLCQPTKAVTHEGGTGAVANRKPPTESTNGEAAQSSSAPFYPRNLARYIEESAVVPAQREPGGCYGTEEATADDGGYIPDWRDEALRGDSDTARELQESRGKAK